MREPTEILVLVVASAAAIAASAVLPISQTISEGGSASWSGNVVMVDTTDGNPTYLAWDFDGDGTDDQVLCDEDPATPAPSCQTSLCNFTSGSFGAKTDLTTGARPESVAMGDFNGDGKPDLAVANFNSGTVSILLGTGTGSFGAKTDFATGASPISVAVGDFNGDGKPDLAVANINSSTVSIFLGTHCAQAIGRAA